MAARAERDARIGAGVDGADHQPVEVEVDDGARPVRRAGSAPVACATAARRSAGNTASVAAHVADPLVRRRQRHEVGLEEVAVVVGVFLDAAGDRAAFGLVPVARLLDHALAGFDQVDLAQRLVFDGAAERPDAVDVLDLAARAELVVRTAAHRHVGVDADRAFFHAPVGRTGRDDDAAQLGDVRARLLDGADVGLAHDLEQRHAGAVVVDERVRRAVDATVATDVSRLARVLFDVGARDADAEPVRQVEEPVGVDRLVVLA